MPPTLGTKIRPVRVSAVKNCTSCPAPDEWTHWTDVERGVQLLCNCVMELAWAPERVNPLEQSVSR